MAVHDLVGQKAWHGGCHLVQRQARKVSFGFGQLVGFIATAGPEQGEVSKAGAEESRGRAGQGRAGAQAGARQGKAEQGRFFVSRLTWATLV